MELIIYRWNRSTASYSEDQRYPFNGYLPKIGDYVVLSNGDNVKVDCTTYDYINQAIKIYPEIY